MLFWIRSLSAQAFMARKCCFLHCYRLLQIQRPIDIDLLYAANSNVWRNINIVQAKRNNFYFYGQQSEIRSKVTTGAIF